MRTDISTSVSITEVNQNFSKAAKLADERGSVIITKNNKRKYIMLSLDENTEINIIQNKSQDEA